MVGGIGLYDRYLGGSPFATPGLERIQGNPDNQQKPDVLVYYTGATTDVPQLVCPGHLQLLAPFGATQPIEIPYFDIEIVRTVEGTAATAKKKVSMRCNIAACQENTVYGVTVKRIADVRYPVVSEKQYFIYEDNIDPDCVTDCSTRAQAIADLINNDPMSIVVATATSASSGSGSGSGTGGTTLTYTLTLEDKFDNSDFIAVPQGFDTYTIVTNFASQSYTVGKLRQAYGPTFAPGKAATDVFRATEIVARYLRVTGDGGGTSSMASINEDYQIQKRLIVVLTDAAVANSVNAKTELDNITNGTKTPVALYLDKQC